MIQIDEQRFSKINRKPHVLCSCFHVLCKLPNPSEVVPYIQPKSSRHLLDEVFEPAKWELGGCLAWMSTFLYAKM